MSTSFLSTFLPDRFSNLRSFLSGLFSTSDVSQEHLKEVYSELDKARPWFLNLLNVPPPTKEERDSVEKGKYSFLRSFELATEGLREVENGGRDG